MPDNTQENFVFVCATHSLKAIILYSLVLYPNVQVLYRDLSKFRNELRS